MKCANTLLFGLFLSVSAAPAPAEEVTLKHQALTLNASLDLAAGKSVADGVIVITHGTLAHRDMEALAYLRSLFAERGYSTLAINLGLGLDTRPRQPGRRSEQLHHGRNLPGGLAGPVF